MGPATGSVGGVVYAAGGYNGSLPGRLSPAAPVGKAGKPAPGTEVNTSYAYTDATGWTAIAPDLVAVFDGSGVSDGSSFYVIGGYNTAGGVDTATQIYDPGTNSWALGAPIPQGVAGAQAVYYNGKIYVIGGCGDGACATVLNTVQIYDIAGNSWSSGATVPTGVTFGQAGAIGSYLYYAGGIDQTQSETVKAYRYDPAADTWDDAAMADMPDTQWGGGYTVLGTKLFVIDGVTANFATVTNRVFTYDAATDTWATDSPTNVAAYRMQATNAAGALYVVGGSTSGFTPTNRVERYELPCTTPTATVTGTPPTATSTVTPTLTPCGEAIANGGFETGDLTNWAIRDSVPAPTVRAGTAHSGTYAAFLGSDPGTEPTGDSSIYQQITVPASGGTLSYWYYPYSEDSITFDWQDAYVTDTNGTILATIMHVCQTTQTWTQFTYDMSAFAGQTVQIEFLVHQDGFGDVTNMYVDDVSLPSTSCGSVTPSPVPTNTNTPVPPTATATTVPPTDTETPVPVLTETETPAPGITETETPVPVVTETETPVPPSATETPVPPTVTETPCLPNFTDVHTTDYFYVPVQYLYCHGVISGYADHTFRPYVATTRSQMVKIVVLGFGLPIVTPPAGGYTFADVQPDFEFYLRHRDRGGGQHRQRLRLRRPGRALRPAESPLLPPVQQRDPWPAVQDRRRRRRLGHPQPARPDLHGRAAEHGLLHLRGDGRLPRRHLGLRLRRPGRALRPAESPVLPPV